LIRLMAGGAAECRAGLIAATSMRKALGNWLPCRSNVRDCPGLMIIDKVTDYKLSSTYNNFYEFGTNRRRISTLPHLKHPWTVEVEGSKNPAKYAHLKI
jgi:DMSO/TMAO reductase YedYZ molybdopterin-dependent catalytic subunit